MPDCEALPRRSSSSPGTPIRSGRIRAYSKKLNATMRKLNAARSKQTRALRQAKTARGQAQAAASLAGAYRSAAQTLASTAGQPRARNPECARRKGPAPGLRSLCGSWPARRARRTRAAYRAATRDVASAERDLRRALASVGRELSAGDDTGTPAGGRRLVAFYLVLAALTVASVALVIAAGADEEPQPEIAGGYHAATPACLGQEFDVKQSGQFVSLDGAGELGGALRFEQGEADRRRDLRGRPSGRRPPCAGRRAHARADRRRTGPCLAGARPAGPGRPEAPRSDRHRR